jgi:membrane protein YdbS with pleckstrin-like domain
MSWRDFVLRISRVPPTPTPPPGSPPRLFRAAPNYFTFKVITWIIAQSFALAGLIVVAGAVIVPLKGAPEGVRTVVRAAEVLGFATFAMQFFYSLAVLRLDFEMRWYMISDRAIRIREGILVVREKTIALANVQNIAIRQGPLQRLLGIADVEVKTAGGGETAGEPGKKSLAEPLHVAYFRGVDNAAYIRDVIREGVRQQRTTGLGDPDEHHHHRDSAEELRQAVAALLYEARHLRRVVEPGKPSA